ncbi:MAG TPA: hemerythrin domain-containing protein [Bacteroidetes bacterium]|nr:hemerythrin domain-containing protein [Bacteroidota bacterium]
MRSPIEIWLKEHREMISYADQLVETLAPDDIQLKLVDPDQSALRLKIADTLDKFPAYSSGHFKLEEDLLVPLIAEHLDTSSPEIKEALGCLTREHGQMHIFVERIGELTLLLQSDEPLDDHNAAELLRVSYGLQSILRHHTSKEEREVYPLVKKLPMKAVMKLMESLDPVDDISLDHLIKPLGIKPGNGNLVADNGEAPEN